MRDREREGTQTIVGKSATANKQTKYFSFVWRWGVAHRRTSGGRQVHPDQTKVVEGQIVKSGHGGRYKGVFTVYRKEDTSTTILGI